LKILHIWLQGGSSGRGSSILACLASTRLNSNPSTAKKRNKILHIFLDMYLPDYACIHIKELISISHLVYFRYFPKDFVYNSCNLKNNPRDRDSILPILQIESYPEELRVTILRPGN
jgi:hypothetical protein